MLDEVAGAQGLDLLLVERGLVAEIEGIQAFDKGEAGEMGAHGDVLGRLGGHLLGEDLVEKVGVGEKRRRRCRCSWRQSSWAALMAPPPPELAIRPSWPLSAIAERLQDREWEGGRYVGIPQERVIDGQIADLDDRRVGFPSYRSLRVEARHRRAGHDVRSVSTGNLGRHARARPCGRPDPGVRARHTT